MSITPIALMAIGTGISAVSTLVSMQAGMQADAYQAQVAAENARRAAENSNRAIERSQIEQLDYAQDARSQIGALVASISASGLDLTTGTPALQQRGLRQRAQRDAERIREEGRETARGFRQQQQDFKAEEGMAKSRKRARLFEGVLGVGSSLIGGATQINRARELIT